MIYEMECEYCKHTEDVVCTLAEHALLVKPGRKCSRCSATMYQIITSVRSVFAREGFPKNDPRWEHLTDEPVQVRDKAHLRDLCEETGSRSRYLEDAV